MIEVRGQWYPEGRSYRRTARLRVFADRFEIWEEGNESPIVAPRAGAKLSAPLGRTNRRIDFEGLGQLEITDTNHAFFSTYFPESERSFEGRLHRLEQHMPAIVAGVIVTAATLGLFVHFGIPAIADRIARKLPHSVEVRLADQTMVILDRALVGHTATPPDEQARLQAAFHALVKGEPRAEQMKLGFVSAPKMGPNAFALPDGRLTVTDELIEAVDHDQNQILAVLAHEAGHHVHYHGTRFAIESIGIAAVLSWFVGDVAGTGVLASLPPALLQARFSRKHETQSDDYAFSLLKKRQISPAAFADAMEAIQASVFEKEKAKNSKVSSSGFKAPEFLSSHPATAERIARARAEAAKR